MISNKWTLGKRKGYIISRVLCVKKAEDFENLSPDALMVVYVEPVLSARCAVGNQCRLLLAGGPTNFRRRVVIEIRLRSCSLWCGRVV
jgi:hypothetical protein